MEGESNFLFFETVVLELSDALKNLVFFALIPKDLKVNNLDISNVDMILGGITCFVAIFFIINLVSLSSVEVTFLSLELLNLAKQLELPTF